MNSFIIFSISLTIFVTTSSLRIINFSQRSKHLYNSAVIEKRTCIPIQRLFQMNTVIFNSHHESESEENAKELKLQKFINFISKQSFLRTITSENLRVSDVAITKSDSFSKLNNRAYGDKLLRLQALRDFFSDVNDIPEDVDALLSLLKCTELLLSIGGDDRLTINNETQMNKYLSSTVPRRQYPTIRRGSCTCSTITEADYDHADALRGELLHEVLTHRPFTADLILQKFDDSMQVVIQRLKVVLGFSAGVSHELVMFPSGSDAEFLPLAVALARSHSLSLSKQFKQATGAAAKVFNFVLAAGEVGSGTPNASWGRHFSPFAPRGDDQQNGGVLDGLSADSVELIQLKPRDANGEVAFNEDALIDQVRQVLSKSSDESDGPIGVAVVHLVCGSKTGLVYPSLATISSLREEWGPRVLVVADCCQLRCRLSAVKSLYVDAGIMCLITGSKFFAAPPFCGAVLLPETIAREMEQYISNHFPSERSSYFAIPSGLSHYITRFDVPTTMPQLRRFLQAGGDPNVSYEEWINVGLYLRWQCGIRSMERYNLLPPAPVELFTSYWVRNVRDLIARYAYPWIQTLGEDRTGAETRTKGEDVEMPGNVCSIISFSVLVPDLKAASGSLRRLDFDEMKELHKILAVAKNERAIMLGQPVKLSDKSGLTILRIALGADMVIDALTTGDEVGVINADASKKIKDDDLFVVTKIAEIARNWGLGSKAEPKVHGGDSQLLSKLNRIDKELVATSSVIGGVDRSVLALETVKAVLNQAFPVRLNSASIFNNDLAPSRLPEVCVLYDMDAFSSTLQALKTAFSTGSYEAAKFTHCFAIKSCPLSYILYDAVKKGLGLEAASLNEVKQALRVGCPANKIVFDSPCKSSADIEFALLAGVHVNANTLTELSKIAAVIERLQRSGRLPASALGPVGLRINPLVGAGEIEALSTATASSKFGVPVLLSDSETVEKIVQTFVTHPFLTSIMCHVGSQGMAMTVMAEGAARIFDLADLIDARCGGKRIATVDIGGGLSANYKSDSITPTFSEYAQILREICGERVTSGDRVVITEFGKSLITKCGAIATVVEDVLTNSDRSGQQSVVTAICHAGADLMLRTAYCPDKFSHRVALLDGTDLLNDPANSRPVSAKVAFVGPLCFSGDVITSSWAGPTPQAGDVCVVLDAGANTLSLFSRHCSRASPAVYAFRSADAKAAGVGPFFLLSCIREVESDQDVLSFWG